MVLSFHLYIGLGVELRSPGFSSHSTAPGSHLKEAQWKKKVCIKVIQHQQGLSRSVTCQAWPGIPKGEGGNDLGGRLFCVPSGDRATELTHMGNSWMWPHLH